ncbi:MAG: DUF1461 domain-containing protein [Candidatus Promineifilaceae bacterium]
MDRPTSASPLGWLISLLLPFWLATGVLLLLIVWEQPSYPEFEYGRIPPDALGLTGAQRLELAEATLAYLRRPEPADQAIIALEALRLPGGRPLYTPREIGHMLDVKRLADIFRKVFWGLSLAVAAGLILLLGRAAMRRAAYQALARGGLLTVGLLGLLIVLILIAWNGVFVTFHALLFPPGTWTFLTTDSLIRLFPEQFWFDFGLIWTAGVLLAGALAVVIGYLLLRLSGPGTMVITRGGR